MVNFLVKVGCIVFVNHLLKLQSHNVLQFIIYYRLFYAGGKATYQPRVGGSPNPEFIRENNLKEILHPVEFVDAIFPVYKKKRVSTEIHPILSLMKTC